jgi:hypothetical protein
VGVSTHGEDVDEGLRIDRVRAALALAEVDSADLVEYL